MKIHLPPLWTALLFVMLGLEASAQNFRIVTGRVLDEDTQEAIPLANVYIEKPQQKIVVADMEGYYYIEIPSQADTLIVNALGYADAKKALVFSNQKDSLKLDFRLKEAAYALSTLEVVASENPANEILRQIIRNKKQNDRSDLPAYAVELYSKVELDLDNLDPSMRDKGLFKKVGFIFDNLDSTSDVKPFLPAYVSERLYQVLYVKGQGKPKELLQAQKVSGIDNQSVVDFINSMYQPYNVYDNWINILGKSFVSPFSSSGLSYYEYYIMDSAEFKGHWSYKLKFKPKRKQENTFYGDFWVAMDVYAVQLLNMRMSQDVNINLVERLILYTEFDLIEGSEKRWLPIKEKLVIDFSPDRKEQSLGIIGRTTLSYRGYDLDNPEQIRQAYKKADPEDLDLDVLNKPDSFWQAHRHEALSENEAAIYKMVDTLQTLPIFKTYADLLVLLGSGYKVLGPAEIGPYWDMFYLNATDGLRIGLGLGTSVNFSNKLRLYGYAGYGLRDKVWKYRGIFQYVLNKQRRREIGAYYHYDAVFEARNTESLPTQSLLAGLLRRDAPQKMLYSREAKLYYQHGFKRGFSARLALIHRQLDPIGYPQAALGGFNFGFLPDVSAPISVLDSQFTTTEAVFRLRFAYKERLIKANFSELSLGSIYPIVSLQYTAGLKGILGSDYAYHRLRFNLRHWFYTNPVGWISYEFEAGRIFGQRIPYLFLEIGPGNEGYFYNENAFNSMNNFEFVADRYLSLRLEHHWDGFLFNRIPLLRKLKWREVLSFRAMLGSLSAENRQANEGNHYDRNFLRHSDPNRNLAEGPFYGTFDQGPFMETSFGVENIFKFFRVDALWRLNYLKNRDVQPFSVRLTINFNF